MNRRMIFISTVILLVGFGLWYGNARLPIINGYASKMTCSCVFVADRLPESVTDQDLDFSLIRFATPTVDYEQKTVTSTVLGFGAQTAVYQKGIGCTLLIDGQGPPEKKPTMRTSFDEANEPWPLGDLNVRSGIPSPQLTMAVQEAMVPELKTRAIIVSRHNEILVEAYGDGFNENTPQLGWSMTKSITSALVGILVGDGKLKIEDPAPVKAWQGDMRKRIALRNLLQMNSGLKWVEDYGDISLATKMLYMTADMGDYASAQKLVYPPDSVWYYSSGTTNILSSIIKETIGDQQAYYEFANKRLFEPCGMKSMVLEPDVSGTIVGSSYAFATARDWTRFGLLYLNDGVFNGQRILPEGWVSFTRQEAKGADGKYGAQWWLNLSKEELPDCPEDIYYCDGFQGQRVYVVPSHDLVVVRLGISNDFDYNGFMRRVLDAVPPKETAVR